MNEPAVFPRSLKAALISLATGRPTVGEAKLSLDSRVYLRAMRL